MDVQDINEYIKEYEEATDSIKYVKYCDSGYFDSDTFLYLYELADKYYEPYYKAIFSKVPLTKENEEKYKPKNNFSIWSLMNETMNLKINKER